MRSSWLVGVMLDTGAQRKNVSVRCGGGRGGGAWGQMKTDPLICGITPKGKIKILLFYVYLSVL
jgi:hypothetical protein